MKLVTNLSLGEQLHLSLSKYGTIKVYFSNNDEYKRNYLMNKTLTVYNVLINMSRNTIVNEENSDYYYLCEKDVLKYRSKSNITGYYLHKDNCTLIRNEILERLLKDE